ncbi:MAG TPA: hypothetical protein VD772_10895, partial [Anseongella sp.]|nr:hypothetical protein [Anseongella sp.]
MKKTALPLILLFLVSGFALLPSAARSQDFDYERAWKKADSLSLEGLPRSAFGEVEKIYEQARRDNNNAMLIKAVIHRMLFQAYAEEDSFAKIVEGLRKDLDAAVFPVRQVLHSLLAETYWKYYEQNRFRLFQRSSVADTAVKDFRSWDYERLLKEVLEHHRLSLGDKEKQQATPVAVLDGVLEGDPNNRFLRPSLYDFLAHRAADFYMKEESSLKPRPEENYFFDNSGLFSDAASFAAAPVRSHDSLSLALKGLQLVQELTRFHLEDSDPSALVAIELKRL